MSDKRVFGFVPGRCVRMVINLDVSSRIGDLVELLVKRLNSFCECSIVISGERWGNNVSGRVPGKRSSNFPKCGHVMETCAERGSERYERIW